MSHHIHPLISWRRWGPSPGRPTLHLWELPLGTPHLALLSDQNSGCPPPSHLLTRPPPVPATTLSPPGHPHCSCHPPFNILFISRLHSLARIPELQNLMKHSRVFLARISICSRQQQGQRVLIIAPTLPTDFPSGSGSKKSACNVGDLGSIPEIPWIREWLPTPVF